MMKHPSSPPIFVVGTPRSGTSLLAAMVGAHPRLACGPETHFFAGMYSDAVAREICQADGWPQKAIDFLYSIEHVGQSIPANYGLTRQELAEALAGREPSMASVLSGMMELHMHRAGKQRWCEKTPNHLPHVDRIRRHYPDSPIIRIVRDPRGVALSLLEVPWGPKGLFSAAEYCRISQYPSDDFFESDPKSHTVRYEDLLRDPVTTLRSLCRFIGEPFDPAILDTSMSADLVNATHEPWKAKIAERIDASRAEAWRNKLSEDQLRTIEACIGDRLRAHGYQASGFEFTHQVEVQPLSALDRYSEIAADLVGRGARFWRAPGVESELKLFLGDPNEWGLAGSRWKRVARTARLACSIVRDRLAGVPVAWVQGPGPSRFTGPCAKLLSWLLPRPMTTQKLPVFAQLEREW